MFYRPASIDNCRVCGRHPSICTCYPLLSISKAYSRRKSVNHHRFRARSAPALQSLTAFPAFRRKR